MDVIEHYNSCMMKENKFSPLIAQLMRRLNLLSKDQIVCYGVTLPQCYTIEALDRKGRLSMKEMAQSQGVTVSTMTRVIDVLVRDEIIERVPAPGDRRKVCIQLTPKGLDLSQKLKGCTEAYTLQLLSHIPQEKQEQVIESLQLLSEAIGEMSQRCCI
jgi:DNA-binding MarR family transcriptional regulator